MTKFDFTDVEITEFKPIKRVGKKREDHTQEELKEAFDKVANKNDWKNPINRWIPKSDLEATEIAVIHFTGSIVHVLDEKEKKVKIRADGYHHAIGM